MEPSVSEKRAEVCHRCLQPVPPKTVRCPNCGDPIKRHANVRVILGVFGLVLFLMMAVLAFRLMKTSGATRPTADTQEQENPLKAKDDTPPPPEKKPALGQ